MTRNPTTLIQICWATIHEERDPTDKSGPLPDLLAAERESG
ncbi:hypothetical protein SMICM17S_12474 [Streptomyces microflavus]